MLTSVIALALLEKNIKQNGLLIYSNQWNKLNIRKKNTRRTYARNQYNLEACVIIELNKTVCDRICRCLALLYFKSVVFKYA